MVVTFLPFANFTGYEQERTASPSTCNVHAPQAAFPQPNFVPFKFNVSLMTQSNGVLSSAISIDLTAPLTVKEIFI